MLAIERRNEILSKLQAEGRVVVSELSQTYSVSEETIRRDLDRLEKEGYADRTYGGAVQKQLDQTDIPYSIRKKTNVTGKEEIARLIGNLIDDGDRIMMDSSSTAMFVARNIKKKKNLTLITNSIEMLIELADVTGWKILSTGGVLREGSLSFTGHQAEKMLASYHVDKAIISCKGLDMEHGITETSEGFALIKKVMFANASKRILAVDSSKFGKISFTEVDALNNVSIIVTDRKPSEAWLAFLRNRNISCIYPGETTD